MYVLQILSLILWLTYSFLSGVFWRAEAINFDKLKFIIFLLLYSMYVSVLVMNK